MVERGCIRELFSVYVTVWVMGFNLGIQYLIYSFVILQLSFSLLRSKADYSFECNIN